jgi:hypothetical protein
MRDHFSGGPYGEGELEQDLGHQDAQEEPGQEGQERREEEVDLPPSKSVFQRRTRSRSRRLEKRDSCLQQSDSINITSDYKIYRIMSIENPHP